MKKLDKLQNEVLAQMMEDETMLNSFSPKLKKAILNVGIVAAVTVASFSSAHAGDNGLRAMLGVSAVTGLLAHGATPVNNLPPECNVQGYSGYKIGGAAAAASYAGNQIGNGSGKTAATIGFALAAGSGAAALEGARIEKETQECYRRIQTAQANYNYTNGQYATDAYYPPNGMPNMKAQPAILYTFQNSRNGPIFQITTENSPGMMALKGQSPYHREVETDRDVNNIIQRSMQGLEKSYYNFQSASENYIKLMNNPRKNQTQLKRSIEDWDKAFNSYAQERAFTAAVFDNAAIDGFRVSQFSRVLEFYNPPPNTTVACECVMPNRYSTVPSNLTIHRR